MLKGTHHTEKSKRKISEAQKGKKLSDEHKRRISEALMGHPAWNKGKTNVYSKESLEKMSEVQRGENNSFFGRQHTEKSKKRISLSQTGVKFSEERKRRISESLMGHLVLKETKQKISEATMGEKHWRWLGGSKHYRGKNWSEYREIARKRDNYICQCCGNGNAQKENDVHHWIPYKVCMNSNLENLVTLCQSCHLYIENRFRIEFPVSVKEGFIAIH